MTRQKKTPRQRAEEALALSTRKVERLTGAHAKLRTQLDQISKDRDAEIIRRDYLATNPDLIRQPQPSTTKETNRA